MYTDIKCMYKYNIIEFICIIKLNYFLWNMQSIIVPYVNYFEPCLRIPLNEFNYNCYSLLGVHMSNRIFF